MKMLSEPKALDLHRSQLSRPLEVAMLMTEAYASAERWETKGVLMAGAAAIQVGSAAIVISRPAVGGVLPFIGLAAAAIISVILTSRAQMPYFAKAVIILLLCVTSTSVAASRDIFGLRAVEHKMVAAQASTAEPFRGGGSTIAPSGYNGVELTVDGDISDAAFAPDVAQVVSAKTRGTDVAVSGIVSLSGSSADPHYTMTWSISRDDEEQWCGRISTRQEERNRAVEEIAQRMIRAIELSRDHALACF